MRIYRAFCDDGHDYFDFEFQSEHRANSKANEEDARMTYYRKYGKRNYRVLKIQREVD